MITRKIQLLRKNEPHFNCLHCELELSNNSILTGKVVPVFKTTFPFIIVYDVPDPR